MPSANGCLVREPQLPVRTHVQIPRPAGITARELCAVHRGFNPYDGIPQSIEDSEPTNEFNPTMQISKKQGGGGGGTLGGGGRGGGVFVEHSCSGGCPVA